MIAETNQSHYIKVCLPMSPLSTEGIWAWPREWTKWLFAECHLSPRHLPQTEAAMPHDSPVRWAHSQCPDLTTEGARCQGRNPDYRDSKWVLYHCHHLSPWPRLILQQLFQKVKAAT